MDAVAHDDPYSDSYVPSEWGSSDRDEHSTSSLGNRESTDASYLSRDDGEEDGFEYRAFLESLNDLRASSPDLSENSYGDDPRHEIVSGPLNSESYTEMTAFDSGYSVPHSHVKPSSEVEQNTGISDDYLSSGVDNDVSAFSERSSIASEEDHQFDSLYPPSTRLPVTPISADSVLGDSDSSRYGPYQVEAASQSRSSKTSRSSGSQNSSSALAERVLPKSARTPQSALSAVVVDRSSRRAGRHVQIKPGIFPSSQKIKQVSAEFLARRKSKQHMADPQQVQQPIQQADVESTPQLAPPSDEVSGPFMTTTTWVLTVLMGLFTMGYWHLRQLGDDWASLWIAGLMVRNDQTDAIYDRSWWDFGSTASSLWSYYRDAFDIAPWPHPFVQAPMVAQFVGILSHFMNYYWSLHLLAFLTGAGIVITVVSAHYIWKKRPLNTRYLLLIVVMLWISQPVVDAAYLGQTTPILFALLLFGIAISEKHPYVSGIALAIVTIVKLTPFVVIVILLFFASRRRSAITALITILLTTVISVSFIGPRIYAEWFKELRVISSEAYVTANNNSLLSLVYTTRGNGISSVTTISHPAPFVSLLALLVGAFLALCVLAAASQLRERSCEILCVGVFVAALLSSNIFWSHYTYIVVVLYLGIFFECSRTQRYMSPVAIATLVLFYPPIAGSASTGSNISWHGSVYWATLFLVVLFCVSVVLEARARSTMRWTPQLFMRNIVDFVTTVVSTGRSGTAIQMRQ